MPPTRRLMLALPAALLLGAATRAPAPAWDGEVPICRGGRRAVAGESPDAEADYLEKLGLLQGHLLVGYRLLEANQSRLAIPHFGHPIRELYTWLEPRLAARSAPQFERELEVMEDWAEGGNNGTGGRFAEAWRALQPKLAAARQAVPQPLRASPKFMLNHVAMIVFDVSSDYGESVERGRIVNIVEFHDSMGYLMYAADTAAAERAAGRAPEAWAEVAGLIAELQEKVYPDLLPGSRPPMSISSVRSRYGRIREIADRTAA